MERVLIYKIELLLTKRLRASLTINLHHLSYYCTLLRFISCVHLQTISGKILKLTTLIFQKSRLCNFFSLFLFHTYSNLSTAVEWSDWRPPPVPMIARRLWVVSGKVPAKWGARPGRWATPVLIFHLVNFPVHPGGPRPRGSLGALEIIMGLCFLLFSSPIDPAARVGAGPNHTSHITLMTKTFSVEEHVCALVQVLWLFGETRKCRGNTWFIYF